MKNYLLIVLLVFSNNAFGQKVPDYGINSVRIIEQDKTLQFSVTSVPAAVAAYTTTPYYWYSGNQVNVTQGSYSGKLLNGPYREFFLNKNLKTEGSFELGRKTGVWKTWNEKGMLCDIVAWKNGIKNGRYILYGADGKMIESGINKLDKPNGPVHFYPKPDSVVTVYYKKGVVTPRDTSSIWKRFNIFRNRNAKHD